MNYSKKCPVNQFYDQFDSPSLELLAFAEEVYKVYREEFYEHDYEFALETLAERFTHKNAQWQEINQDKVNLLLKLCTNEVHHLHPMVIGEFFLNQGNLKNSMPINQVLLYFTNVLESIERTDLKAIIGRYKASIGCEGKPMVFNLPQLCDEFEEIINVVLPKLSKVKEYVNQLEYFIPDHIPEVYNEDKTGAKENLSEQEESVIRNKMESFSRQFFKEWGNLSNGQLALVYKVALTEVSIYNPAVWLILFPEDFTLNYLVKLGLYYYNVIELKK